MVFHALLVAAVAAAVPARGAEPSFDCRKATLADEKAICADPQLARLDRLITDAFRDFEPSFGGSKRQIGRLLVADRHRCGGEVACIANVMVNALQTFGSVPSWAEAYAEALIGAKAAAFGAHTPHGAEQPLPQAIGACAVTHVSGLATRLGDTLEGAEAGSGVAVSFADGGVQTSYGDVPAVSAARPGDPAVVCLMSTPRDCPAGDGRGRVYYALDLRTGGTWALPDAEHMCGGA